MPAELLISDLFQCFLANLDSKQLHSTGGMFYQATPDELEAAFRVAIERVRAPAEAAVQLTAKLIQMGCGVEGQGLLECFDEYVSQQGGLMVPEPDCCPHCGAETIRGSEDPRCQACGRHLMLPKQPVQLTFAPLRPDVPRLEVDVRKGDTSP